MDDKQMTINEADELMAMRESVYRLLSSLYFKELSQEQIEFLAQQDFSGLDELDPEIARGAADIKRALRRINSGTREDLAVDYAHTFLAAGSYKDEARACPYESVFTSRDGLIMQEARDEVYRYMLAEHLAPSEDLRIPEDHIAFVLEFMANLCARYAQAREAGDVTEAKRLVDVQKRFFDEHIGNWIDKLLDAIENCCRTDFYRGVARITRGFVGVEREMLPAIVAAVEA